MLPRKINYLNNKHPTCAGKKSLTHVRKYTTPNEQNLFNQIAHQENSDVLMHLSHHLQSHFNAFHSQHNVHNFHPVSSNFRTPTIVSRTQPQIKHQHDHFHQHSQRDKKPTYSKSTKVFTTPAEKTAASQAALFKYKLNHINMLSHAHVKTHADPINVVKSPTVSEDELGRRVVTFHNEFPLQLGGKLPNLEILWQEWGPADGEVIYIFPALSSPAHITSSTKNPARGWWEDIVGENKWIDTKRYRVVSAAILGSPFGSSSPLSTNPKTGKRFGAEFPQITTADQAHCHKILLEFLGISKLKAIIGSSLGGMQALQFAVHFPDMAEKLIAISTTARTSPGSVAIRRIQRSAILSDPEFCGGNYFENNKWPFNGMKTARMLGLISYRSRSEFDSRFDWNPQHNNNDNTDNNINKIKQFGPNHITFEVESWLDIKSMQFSAVYDPNCYLLLSKCMDLNNISIGISGNLDDAFQRIKAKTKIIGVTEDTLIPPEEQVNIHEKLTNHGKYSEYEELSSPYGHDAFLHESDWFGPRLKEFIEK